MACRISYDNTRVAAFYSDRSFFIWDIKDPKKIGKYRSHLAHSSCIWDVQTYPSSFGDDKNTSFPEETFMTCSADNTIRFWNLELDDNDNSRPPSLVNPFSKHCLRTIFIGKDLSSMKARIDNGKNNPKSPI